MNQYEALKEIFSQSKTKHTRSATFRSWKNRFRRNALSQSMQVIVLKKFGYKVAKLAEWTKNK